MISLPTAIAIVILFSAAIAVGSTFLDPKPRKQEDDK